MYTRARAAVQTSRPRVGIARRAVFGSCPTSCSGCEVLVISPRCRSLRMRRPWPFARTKCASATGPQKYWATARPQRGSRSAPRARHLRLWPSLAPDPRRSGTAFAEQLDALWVRNWFLVPSRGSRAGCARAACASLQGGPDGPTYLGTTASRAESLGRDAVVA